MSLVEIAATLMTLALLAFATAGGSRAATSILAQQGVTVTNQQIQESLVRNGASPSLAQAGANLSSNMEDRGGALGIYNGSCCTGVLQVTGSNLRAYCQCTSQQYAAMSLDQQTAVWMKLTNDNFRSGAIHQLNGMTTFDGQPVNDGFKLACVQLGPRNCQQMLDSGSCSGFKDKNGTTICAMAAAINAGSTSIGSTITDGTVGGPTGAGAVQGGGAGNELTMSLGNPAYCWSCDVIVYAMGFSEAVMTKGLPIVFGDLRPLLLVMLGIGFVNAMAMTLISGDSPLRPIRTLYPRLFLAVFLIGIGGGVIGPIVIGDIMTTSLTAGADFGNTLASGAATALNINLDNTNASGTGNGGSNDCLYASAATVKLDILIPAEQEILRLACTIHHAATTQLQLAVFLMNADQHSLNPVAMAYSALFVMVGGIMAATTMLTMLRFGLMILDLMVTMSVFVVMTPYMIFAWVFPSTKRSTTKYLKTFVHAFVLLAFSGIGSVVAVLLLLTSMQFGLGLPISGTPDPDQLLNAAKQFINNLSFTDPAAVGRSALLALGCLGGSMVSNRILAAIPGLTSKVTGVKVPTALSSAAVNAIMGFGRAAMGGGAAAATGLVAPIASTAGRVAGSVAGRAFGR